MNTTKEILDIVRSINQHWIAGAYDHVRPFLHLNVVFVNTAGAVRTKGRTDCIAAFRNFIQHVQTRAFRLYDEKVEMWDQTAVASYEFTMTYELAGKDFEKKGREVIVFNKEGENWRVIYRTLSPF